MTILVAIITAPTTLFNVFADALFAITAAILAHKNVNITQSTRLTISGIPPTAKWLTPPVNAVNAIINTLVPTSVSSKVNLPSTLVGVNVTWKSLDIDVMLDDGTIVASDTSKKVLMEYSFEYEDNVIKDTVEITVNPASISTGVYDIAYKYYVTKLDSKVGKNISLIKNNNQILVSGNKEEKTIDEPTPSVSIENMNFDDPEFTLDDISFRDDETTRKYIDTAISKNIQHSLKNDKDGMYFNQLRTLYDNNELTNVINRIVESMNHEFLVRIIEEEFKSHDLGSAKNLLLHDAPEDRAYVLENIDKEKVTTILKSLVEIKETYETKVHVTQDHIDKVKSYLKVLDLIVNIPVRYESGSRDEYYVFTQPGMRYSLVKALVYSLMKDSYFSQIPETDKLYIIEKISTDVKGRMMEDIVLLEVSKSINKNKEAFKLKFDLGGEIDMIIYDRETNTNKIFEIKHSEKASRHQTRHLIDQNKCQYIEKIYGKTIGKYVIYRGENKIIDGIEYLNVEEYLCTL